jgi:hypothetical protein
VGGPPEILREVERAISIPGTIRWRSSPAISARSPQAELTASVQLEDWRPAWTTGGVEVHGITIETKLRDDAEGKPRDFRMSDLPAMIFWPLVIVQIAFFAWVIFSTVAWWRL